MIVTEFPDTLTLVVRQLEVRLWDKMNLDQWEAQQIAPSETTAKRGGAG